MKQVTRLFQDLAVLVKLQGELINNIEMNIKTAKNAVIEGEKNIIQSKKNMQSARKVYFIKLEKMLYFDYSIGRISCYSSTCIEYNLRFCLILL